MDTIGPSPEVPDYQAKVKSISQWGFQSLGYSILCSFFINAYAIFMTSLQWQQHWIVGKEQALQNHKRYIIEKITRFHCQHCCTHHAMVFEKVPPSYLISMTFCLSWKRNSRLALLAQHSWERSLVCPQCAVILWCYVLKQCLFQWHYHGKRQCFNTQTVHQHHGYEKKYDIAVSLYSHQKYVISCNSFHFFFCL